MLPKSLIALMLATALCLSASARATPVVFCELASLPPTEALERLAESYRGLLEFGGEQFSPDTTSLEKLFAPVVGRDQRSVALNESLTKLGDWVMLDAEDQGLSRDAILTRLREVVSQRAVSVSEQLTLNHTRQEARREVRSSVRRVSHQSLKKQNPRTLLDQGRALILSEKQYVEAWDIDQGGLKSHVAMTDVGADVIAAYPTSNPEHLLLFKVQTRQNEFQVLDRHTLKEVRSIVKLAPKVGRTHAVSPSGRYLAVGDADFSVYDLETGRKLEQPGPMIAIGLAWGADDTRLLLQVDGAAGSAIGTTQLEVWKVSPDEGLVQELSVQAPRVDGGIRNIYLGSDPRRVVLGSFTQMHWYDLSDAGAVLIREFEDKGAALRHVVRQQDYIVAINDAGVFGLSLLDGSQVFSLGERSQGAYHLVVSPSGRRLAVASRGQFGSRAITVWDPSTQSIVDQYAPDVGLRPWGFTLDETELLMINKDESVVPAVLKELIFWRLGES